MFAARKFGFLWGVFGLVTTEYMILSHPSKFYGWYMVAMGTYLGARYPYYKFKKWGYFLLDFW